MIIAIVQARIGSTRLPGKSILSVNDKTLVDWVIDAALGAKTVDEVVLATTTNVEDDIFKKRSGVYLFRGHPTNVLNRFYLAALPLRPLHIVRLTADCPMLLSRTIDQTVKYHLVKQSDYTRNSRIINEVRQGFPSGFGVEVFTMNMLTIAEKLAISEYDREHVTPFMNDEEAFKVGYYLYPDIEYNEKMSIDTMEEYIKVKKEMESSGIYCCNER